METQIATNKCEIENLAKKIPLIHTVREKDLTLKQQWK